METSPFIRVVPTGADAGAERTARRPGLSRSPRVARASRSAAPARWLALAATGACALGALAQAPSVAEINPYLIVGMRPSASGQAVTVGSSQELGANRQTLSGGTPSGDPDSNRISPIEPVATPLSIGPSLDTPNLRGTFFSDPSAPLLSPDKNRWFWDNDADAHYLPGATFPGDITDRLFLFRGVDWSGDIAVTSPSGTFSLQDMRVFGQFGIRARNQSAPANVSNSYYYDAQSPTPLAGVLMDSIEDSLPSPDAPDKGWDGGVDLARCWPNSASGAPSSGICRATFSLPRAIPRTRATSSTGTPSMPAVPTRGAIPDSSTTWPART